MKKIFCLLIAGFFALVSFAQTELHIHHINIENGDATLIGIYDIGQQKYVYKILIDGGQTAPADMLLPYIKQMIGDDEESFHFNYVILTHYHDDHYKGLLALGTGQLTVDSIIDPGGYKVSAYFDHTALAGKKPDSMKIAKAWLTMLKKAKAHMPQPYIKGRSKIMIRFDAGSSTSIGNKIIMGKVGGNEVVLECIAGWGNTLSSAGLIKKNPAPKKTNANNYTLAFILTCGQFRYFIGGDMGGDAKGQYIDQETTVTKFLVDEFPQAVSISGDKTAAGHVCGFKANHHGSKNSNTTAFMQAMTPSLIVTSAGDKASWHLPNVNYIQLLAAIKPLSASSALSGEMFIKGVYFTNLYNFSGFPSKTKANTLFKNKPGVSYDFGNNNAASKCSYLIKMDGNGLDEKSRFEVGRVDILKNEPYEKLAGFLCHKKD